MGVRREVRRGRGSDERNPQKSVTGLSCVLQEAHSASKMDIPIACRSRLEERG